MLFACRVQQLRTQSGLSLHELAWRASLTETHLAKIESGEEIPSCCALDIISEALQVPLCQLFYDQQPPPTPWLTRRRSLEEYFTVTGGLSAKVGFRNSVRVLISAVTSLLQ
jgi:transcriptional regulator with XRE-family HTH domain